MNNILVAGEEYGALLNRMIAGYNSRDDTIINIYDPAGILTDAEPVEKVKNESALLERLRRLSSIADLRRRERAEGENIKSKPLLILAFSDFSAVAYSDYRAPVLRELLKLASRCDGVRICVVVATRYISAQILPPALVRLFAERWATKTLTTAESRGIIDTADAVSLPSGWALCRDRHGLQKLRIE